MFQVTNVIKHEKSVEFIIICSDDVFNNIEKEFIKIFDRVAAYGGPIGITMMITIQNNRLIDVVGIGENAFIEDMTRVFSELINTIYNKQQLKGDNCEYHETEGKYKE